MVRLKQLAYAISMLIVGGHEWALAQSDTRPVGLSDSVYSASASALAMLFVIAVVLESAFAIIFNWRIFLAYFNSRGVKTIIMVLVSLLVVYGFDLDVVASLVAAYKLPSGQSDAAALVLETAKVSGVLSKFITALVLAGGSTGVHNLMNALGFRSSREAEADPVPRQDEAWVAVKVKRINSVGPVQVSVSEVAAAAVSTPPPPALAGSIRFSRPPVRDLLLRNIDRFPQNGGYVVRPGKVYQIIVEGVAANGDAVRRLDDRQFSFAPRAIVDLEVDL